MATMLAGLLELQSVELELAHVRGKLGIQENAVTFQQSKIDRAGQALQALNNMHVDRRKHADRLELELKEKDEHVSKLRTSLNTAKTNKEYAAVLTEINTFKADNAKVEESELKLFQEIDTISEQVEQAKKAVQVAEQRLVEIEANCAEQIEKLNALIEELSAKRTQATEGLPREALYVFQRLAGKYEGQAMAVIEEQGKKPPFSYVCGGCFMGLNTEHVNALKVRDQIRTCDNCGRILYLHEQEKASTTE